jgi:hypothetical protein
MKNKPAKSPAEIVDDGAEEEAVDAYEELAIFFDEEDPASLVPACVSEPSARFRTRNE